MEGKPGRFTGRQLMFMFMALCATAVLIPTAAWAAARTGSAVNIVDPTTATSKAAVESSGRLKVDTGLNSVYGLVPTLTTGTVTANIAFPTSSIVHSDDGNGSPDVYADSACPLNLCTKLIAPPAGQALVITAIHINTNLNSEPGSGFRLIRSADGTCTQTSLDLTMESVNPPGTGLTDLQYPLPGGMTIPAGKELCVLDTFPAVLSANVTAWGYSVPSSAVPAVPLAPGAPRGAALVKATG